ncbi:MAG: cell wall hydrolase [Bacilli bacterium]|nr:cell wall hydrolase [Bacilli bacterium]
MDGQKTLDIEGLISNSSELNRVSTDLNDICSGLYSTITTLRDNGQFISVTASGTYFESIDNLNQMVPKFTEAILKFSKFLSDYVLQNYTEMDEEIRSKVETNLSDSLAKLNSLALGSGTGASVDYTKIASTAQGALEGNFIDDSKVHKESFEGELEFVTRDDGSVVITKNGVPIGFTTQDGINMGIGAASAVGAGGLASSLSTGVENLTTSASQDEIVQAATGTESVSVPNTSNSAPTIEQGISSSEVSAGYTGAVHTKSQASSGIKQSSGTITTGHQSYTIVPDTEYRKQPGTISESDYNLLCAQVAGESGNSKDDMLGVTTTVLNRLEAGGFGGSVSEVLERGYFPWGESYRSYVESGKTYAGGAVAANDGRYASTSWGQEKISQVKEVVNDALGGVRNLEGNVYYYSGNGEYNRFSDVL